MFYFFHSYFLYFRVTHFVESNEVFLLSAIVQYPHNRIDVFFELVSADYRNILVIISFGECRKFSIKSKSKFSKSLMSYKETPSTYDQTAKNHTACNGCYNFRHFFPHLFTILQAIIFSITIFLAFCQWSWLCCLNPQ